MRDREKLFRECVDGTARGLGPSAFRTAARLISAPYSIVVRTRNFLYDIGFLREFSASRPTISVGNLTLGGVGKTPLIGWLTEFFLENGRLPGLISRGYKADEQKKLFAKLETSRLNASSAPNFPKRTSSFIDSRVENGAESNGDADFNEKNDVFASSSDASARFASFEQFNDEARELSLRFPNVPHFLGANRVEAASALLEKRPDVDVLLLDDAFQHRRIRRDLNVALIDALNPFGFERVFPAGFLREPLSGLKRADVVLANRANLVSPSRRAEIRRRVERMAPNALWGEIAQVPRFAHSASFCGVFDAEWGAPGVETAIGWRFEYLNWRTAARTRRFVAFCGLGAPLGFARTLEREGIRAASFVAFPDHRAYSESDFKRLEREFARTDADAALTTLKDLVKLGDAKIAGKPIFALEIGVEFLTGEKEFRALLTERFGVPKREERKAA